MSDRAGITQWACNWCGTSVNGRWNYCPECGKGVYSAPTDTAQDGCECDIYAIDEIDCMARKCPECGGTLTKGDENCHGHCNCQQRGQ